MEHLSLIHHCGITDAPMTSVQNVLSRPVALHEVRLALVQAFSQVFNLTLVNYPNPLPALP